MIISSITKAENAVKICMNLRYGQMITIMITSADQKKCDVIRKHHVLA